MADNKKKRKIDSKFVFSLTESYERRYWTKKFKCTERELLLAIFAGATRNAWSVGYELRQATKQLRRLKRRK